MIKYFGLFLLALQCFAADPSPLANYAPVVIADATTLNDPTRVYFVAHALDPCGLPCYLVPDENGICQYVYPSPTGTPSSASSSISKRLSDLPTTTTSAQPVAGVTYYLIYLPVCSSARAYISVDHPMYLPTIFNPAPQRQVLDIGDSSVTALNDVNYYTLYQDFEFGLVNYDPATNTTATVATTLFLNLSWVDYFCLPMNLSLYSWPSNTLDTAQPISGISYGPTGQSREQVITGVNTTFSALPNVQAWDALNILFYANPYTDTTSVGTTRILAAKNSISLGSTTNQFQGAAVAAQYFPSDYLTGLGSTTAPKWSSPGSNSFIHQVSTHYTGGTQLNCQVIPAGGDSSFNYTFNMVGDPSGLTLTFNCDNCGSPAYGVTPPTTMTFSFEGPGGVPAGITTEQILAGGVWAYSGAASNGNNDSFRNEFTKMISALFCVGQLPLVNYGGTNPFVVKQQTSSTDLGGFAQITPASGRNGYFQTNNSFSSGPWYNAYDQALHLNFTSKGSVYNNPSYGLAYGYDYDDALNMAGLVQPGVQDAYGNPFTNTSNPTEDSPYVMMVLGSLAGTPLASMNIDNDTYTYSVSVAPAVNGVGVEFFYYTSSSSPKLTLVPLATENTDPVDVYVDKTHPFQVQFTYNSQTYTYNINLQRQLALPLGPSAPYSSVDQQLIEGISFVVPIPFPAPPPAPPVVTKPSFLIKVDSTPPEWPG